MILQKSNPNSIEIVAQALKDNKVVIIPTDTVYGFSGIVPEADSAIRVIKGRDEVKPFIQLVSKPSDIQMYSKTIIPSEISKHMPGPITVIVENIHDNGTTAFRCPDDEWLQKLITVCEKPLYSTSTNRSGSPILNSIKEIQDEFEKEVFCIVDGNIVNNEKAIPSTLVDISKGKITVLRQGSIYV